MRITDIKLLIGALASVALFSTVALADSHATSDTTLYSNLEFAPMGEGSPVEISVLWGDPAVGPVGFLIRIPEGFESPLHWHTSNYRAVVLEGTHQHWVDGEDQSKADMLNTGSYFVQPGGQVHGDANVGEGPVLAFIYFDGPLDSMVKE